MRKVVGTLLGTRLGKKLASLPFFGRFMTVDNATQIFRYLIVGFSSFALEMLLFTVFRLFRNLERLCASLGMHQYMAANIMAYVIVFWFNFLLNRKWSFKSEASLLRQVVLYGFLFFFNMAASGGIIFFLHEKLKCDVSAAKFLSMFAIVSWNFFLYRLVIFKPARSEDK